MHVKINVIFSLNCDQYFLNQNCVYFELMSFEELPSAIMMKKLFVFTSNSHQVLIVNFMLNTQFPVHNFFHNKMLENNI